MNVADYLSTPVRGDAVVFAEATVRRWYDGVCEACGFPTSRRSARPLAFAPRFRWRFGAALITDAHPSDVGDRPSPPRFAHPRVVTLADEVALAKLVKAIPAVEPAFRPTGQAGVFELDARGTAALVARTAQMIARFEAKRCPSCDQLVEPLRPDKRIIVRLAEPAPPFFVFEGADCLRLFVRRDLYPTAVGAPSAASMAALVFGPRRGLAVRPRAKIYRR